MKIEPFHGPGKKIVSLQNIFLISIYLFINALFVWKYVSPYFSIKALAPFIYIALAFIFILILTREYNIGLRVGSLNIIYFSAVLLFAILLTVLMLQFDPGDIKVGRYPALHDWITKLFNVEFPYDSSARPSGLPFLFILAMPFYFLGDLGAFQIFSFLLFALIVHLRFHDESSVKLRLLLLLIFAPIFIYEIVVRSDLFSNMIVVILYLLIIERYGPKNGYIIPIALGLAGGFLLSTRGIVLLVYIVFFVNFLRKQEFKSAIFLVSMVSGFLLTLMPFALWNWQYFFNYGPFAVQLSYVPGWFVLLSIAFSLILALKIKSDNEVYFGIAFILFFVVFAAFVIFVVRFGLTAAVHGNKFDISYFCFSLPFLLISLGATTRSRKGINSFL